jgi:hypothetical protein
MRRLGLLMACAVLAACETRTAPLASPTSAVGGTSFQLPPAGKGALYVAAGYIPDMPSIVVGPSTVGSLAQNSWLRIDLAPGTYALQARSPYSISSLSVTIAAEASIFVQLQFVDGRPWRDVLSEVSETQGRALVSAARRVAESP